MKQVPAAVALLVLAGCGLTEVDIEVVEDDITIEVEEQLGDEVTVDCPDQVEWKTGETFTCDVAGAEDIPTEATVEMIDDEGNVEWSLG